MTDIAVDSLRLRATYQPGHRREGPFARCRARSFYGLLPPFNPDCGNLAARRLTDSPVRRLWERDIEADVPRSPLVCRLRVPVATFVTPMKIQLPFNLLPHLEGTSIAACFGLKNHRPEDHTVIELKAREAHDLLELLKALEADLHSRCLKWQKLASRSPIGFTKRPRVELNRQAVRRAVEMIEAALHVSARGKA